MSKKSTRKATIAESSDRHAVYQKAVQSPQADIELLQYFYTEARGRKAYHFREDFCGTGLTLSHWVKQGKRYTGEGFDIDKETVDWGQEHNFDPLGTAGKRGKLHIEDARAASDKSPDVRCAFNFSYWIFTEREIMLEYFRSVHKDLADKGIFVMDFHGGPESVSEEESVNDYGDFESVWHQVNFSPVTHHADLSLHFRFPDGSSMEKAFSYHWRIWSIPEITDILKEAGFRDFQVYWDDGEGEYEITRTGFNDPSWIACLVAIK